MASGDPTLTNLGMHTISGNSLKTAVDGLTEFHPLLSGSSLHFVPAGEGQINLLRVDIEATG